MNNISESLTRFLAFSVFEAAANVRSVSILNVWPGPASVTSPGIASARSSGQTRVDAMEPRNEFERQRFESRLQIPKGIAHNFSDSFIENTNSLEV